MTDLKKVKKLYDYLKIDYTELIGSVILIESKEGNITEIFTFDLAGKFMYRDLDCYYSGEFYKYD